MANHDAPRGFRPVKYRSGKAYTGAAKTYYKDASVILGIGDPVVIAANSSCPLGYQEVTRATTGAAISGIVVGREVDMADLTKMHVAAADACYVRVADEPDLILEAQEVSGGTPLAISNLGQHIDAVAAINANTTTGISNYELDNAAVATDNTFRLEELVQRADNELGEHAKWLVSINLHTNANASATNLTEV